MPEVTDAAVEAVADTPVESPVAGPSGRPLSPALLLLVGGRLVRDRLESELGRRGTSLRQLGALGHLKTEPGLSYSELARRAGVTPQSMQATLNQLEAQGAVERLTPPGRGRAARLHLTAAGSATLSDAEAAIDTVSDQVMSDLPPAEHSPTIRALFRIITALTQPPGHSAGGTPAEPGSDTQDVS